MVARILVLSALAAGCGGETDSSDPPPEGHCPAGEMNSDAGCVPVGIHGCAAMFVDSDGQCRPSTTKCPAGMIPKLDEGCIEVGIIGCAPAFLEADGHCYPTPDKCPAGTFPVPTEGCVPIDGDGCGTGTWGDIADAPNTIWVDPAYAGVESTGSKLQPVTTIAAATSLVTPGGRMALAAGDYAEPIFIDIPLEIVGRCPSMVSVSGVQSTEWTPAPAIVLAEFAEGAALRGLRISGAGIGVLVIGGSIEVTGVQIDRATSHALVAAAGALHLEGSLVQDTLPGPGTLGGVEAQQGASVTIHRSAFVNNSELSLWVADPETTLTMSDSVVVGTSPSASGRFGHGFEVIKGASFTLERSALLANHDAALVAADAGTSVTVRESLVGRTLPKQSDLIHGLGVSAAAGAHVALERSCLVENRDVAVLLTDPGTTGVIDESLVTKTLPRESDLGMGRGIQVQIGATLTLTRSAVLESHDVGVLVGSFDPQARASATVSDTVIEHTLARKQDEAWGVAMGGSYHADLVVSRTFLRDSQTAALLVTRGASLALSASLIDEIRSGKFHSYVGETIVATYEGIGDGTVAAFGSHAQIDSTAAMRATRAGLIFADSDGVLRAVHTVDSRIGLVLQGAPRPDWQHASNVFEGSEQAIVADGQLPVPDAPPLPQ